jgi:hypothetical protein
MRNTLVIARRELLEKRFVFVTAVAFSVLAMILPFVPGVRTSDRAQALAIVSLIFSAGFTVGLAAILGASIIGRELSDGRLSFYFSKPVSAASIWFGKLIAATLLIALSFAIIALPGFVAGFRNVLHTWTNLGDALPAIRIVLVAAAVVFLLGHVIGTFVRSRSVWLVFDFVAAAMCGVAIWMIGRALAGGFAFELIKTLAIIVSVFAGVAIIAAGAWQVARGRTDRKRSHIELSRFLWIAIGGLLLATAAYTMWVTSVPFADLIPDAADHSPNGAWAIISGLGKNRADYRASFLYDLRNGRTYRLTAINAWNTANFSGDEQTVAWVARAQKAPNGELYVAKLGGETPRIIATEIPATGNYALSHDGSRAVITGYDGLITVYDIARRSSLGSARIPFGNYRVARFITNDVVRIYASAGDDTQIYEYNAATKSLAQTGAVAGRFYRFNPEQTRGLVYWRRPALEIRDARTGGLIATAAVKANSAKFLRNGRIVGVEDQMLHVVSPEGVLLRSMRLPGALNSPVFDVGGGLVVVVVITKPGDPWTDLVIDVDRGAIVRTETGLMPSYSGSGPKLLAVDKAHDVILWTPATGEKQVILKRS